MDNYHYSFSERILFPGTNFNRQKLKNFLQKKTILITGASFGIGEALASELAVTGAMLILTGRTASKLSEIRDKIIDKGGRAEIFCGDLRNQEVLDQLINYLLHLPGGVDIFVNNAGKSIHRYIMNSLDRYHDFARLMAVNFNAPIQLILALIPALIKNKGHIINISAANVLLAPAPGWSAYQASKAAFDNWFRCIMPEMNANKVAMTSIYLPLVKTRMIEPTIYYANKPAMKPAHVAAIICKYMITRKRLYRPWWLFPVEIASLLFRRMWEKLTFIYMKRKDRAGESQKTATE